MSARPAHQSSASARRPAGQPRSTARLRSILRGRPVVHASAPSSDDGAEDDDEDEDKHDSASDLSPSLFSTLGYLGSPLQTDDHDTVTSRDQAEVERRVDAVVREWKQATAGAAPSAYQPAPSLLLARDAHINYLLRSLELLPAGYASLDASRPWLVYWTLQSLAALSFPLPLPIAQRCLRFLALCQHPHGGYSGGPGQQPHLAPTYAAVNALCLLSGVESVGAAAFQQVDRRRMLPFLLRMKQTDGGFAVCDDGECDTRGVYTAVSVACMCNLLTEQLTAGVAEYVARCQTYEGGMGAEPGNEAHGGYTFCSVATLLMLGRASAVRLEGVGSVREWTVRRQMRREGGFCGRSNKLVDGCYSFWVGALFPLLDLCSHQQPPQAAAAFDCFDHRALQRYVLLGGQSTTGGLRDKPGKGADLYHTCYCLSGLSLAQHAGAVDAEVVGGARNRLRRMNPLFNVPVEDAERGLLYFAACDKPDDSWT